ncbi:hypothetical protein SRS16CHR_00005 [Variovorax sp. SRS16]|uniref:carboxypeptidase-like regulatory domain-containing protein n=1 Tax=Variovorax sp. SRS16 TaxID=282217 RepID=UPI0013162701|nr:carboxypeptidase-like regulatory domain-containing protein [Variovorax sp. SRS16]VTU12766.1 hypothetical protein SRS16CHR_00005 [Variovorax sp. SRS16]
MNTIRFWRPAAALAIGGASLFGALAAHAIYNPPIHMANGIEYMSGGIGSDEAALMKTVSPRWPATFEFAVKDRSDKNGGDFAAGISVTVRDASGHEVLNHVSADGPFMVARLDPGRYEVEATLAGQTLKQEVDVHAGMPARTLFVWPAGTDTTSAHS